MIDSYLSTGFGKRTPRHALERSGSLPQGHHLFVHVLAPLELPLSSFDISSSDGSIVFPDLGSLHWNWPITDSLSKTNPSIWIHL